MTSAKKGELVDIRLSHLLRDCSVGAIVRSGKVLMVVEDIREWYPNDGQYEREIHHVNQVKKALGLVGMKLCQPPVKREKGGHVQGWVPATRFPRWTRCNRCDLLHHMPWRDRDRGSWGREGANQHEKNGTAESSEAKYPCTGRDRKGKNCKGNLEQVPWVLIHEAGYLADVPWRAFAHKDATSPKQRSCQQNTLPPRLKLVVTEEGKQSVRCDSCGAAARLPDRFSYGMEWMQPWFNGRPQEPPSTPGLVVGVNDVRVHFAECPTAIVIPPESRIRQNTVVDKLYGSSDDQKSIRNAPTRFVRDQGIMTLADKHRCQPEDIECALEKIDAGYPLYGRKLPKGELAPLEYGALTKTIPDLRDDEDFVTEHQTASWRRLRSSAKGKEAGVAAAVDRLVSVRRLKEIMVFKGFRRCSGEDGASLVLPHIVGESDWLPALELWGEGLFFTLGEALVARWEAQESAQARAREFVERSVEAWLPPPVETALSPRFLLCHTLAHLIIRRLEATAGYPAASLKERIYCASGNAEGGPMAGVLIYVAVADEHGSLGGLMDMARPDRFFRLLNDAVDTASWCSFDPVCREQEGHGPDLLNRAACHACALVPEPSCVCGNRLLDRAFVAGDGADLRSLWEFTGASGESRRQ